MLIKTQNIFNVKFIFCVLLLVINGLTTFGAANPLPLYSDGGGKLNIKIPVSHDVTIIGTLDSINPIGGSVGVSIRF